MKTRKTFIGLHIYLVAADLIYNILDRFIITITEHFLSPLINALLGDTTLQLNWKIGKGENDIIDLGEIIKESIKLFIIALMSFNLYKAFKGYRKYNNLKFAGK